MAAKSDMSRLIEKNKPWIGLSFGCSENTIEPLSNLLFEMGATGILEKGKTIEGYFAADAPLDDMKTKLQKTSGFTLLIAIITTSMLLIVSFVVMNVALKQLILLRK